MYVRMPYQKIMEAPVEKKSDIYRYELMMPFKGKWDCYWLYRNLHGFSILLLTLASLIIHCHLDFSTFLHIVDFLMSKSLILKAQIFGHYLPPRPAYLCNTPFCIKYFIFFCWFFPVVCCKMDMDVEWFNQCLGMSKTPICSRWHTIYRCYNNL